MFTNYIKIAWRNLVKNKVYSILNISGLALGMAVAMLIGLWIYDEISFDKYHKNYERIGQIMQSSYFQGEFGAGGYMPLPLGDELKTKYADDFKYVIMSSWTLEHILAQGENKFTKTGNYLSPEAPEMLSLKMLKGNYSGLKDMASILLSEATAKSLFGNKNPIGQLVKIDNRIDVKVTGVYENIPKNSQFVDLNFIAPWDLYVANHGWVKSNLTNWYNNSWQILAQLSPNADIEKVNDKIKLLKEIHDPEFKKYKTAVIFHPMSKWHLYSGWDKSGKLEGRIQYVWLFGIIAIFVLILACINFMNLSTARSEKRAKEVGIRKAVGSERFQLIFQFFGESILIVFISFFLSILLVAILLPFFNEIAGKQLSIMWSNPLFWLAGIAFSLFTSFIAGLYPALYLSSFNPVKILKGTFKVGKSALIPRKVMVVVQFTVSITLIISTIIVYRQIQHAKNRPIGYSREGLITVNMNTPELYKDYNLNRQELLNSGAVSEMSTSSTPATNLNSTNGGFDWQGKDPNFDANFGTISVSHDFGKTVGWKFKEGRDFSRNFATDSSGMVINATAAKYMNLKDPVGKLIKWNDRTYQILGVIEDMVMGSPFDPIYQTVFVMDYGWANFINIKLNPAKSTSESIVKIGQVFHKINPGSPFDFKFSDYEYNRKFVAEEQIGKLATFFAILAIFISCLGLFGLASFVAEQRTKEIGVRKVLGATVTNLWILLSKEFVFLVIISILIASPITFYFMDNWVQKYTYRTDISWWIFIAAGAGSMIITLLTISYQTLKAALMNPVKSLRTD